MTADLAPRLAEWEPLRLEAPREGEAGGERKRKDAQPECKGKKQGGSNAKW
jgi:hypothetical protein